ncbi:esterase family protein [Nocardia sp. NBC_00508]|uniref:alpha/beta hydrolase n=1 Tax=Nocardia sp. NBC_00508 TaxID=2975992 RepID=UPI002E81F52A|nr:alpha/beta hydrolase family protein [Nocardia sp. NBC_00508]WUD65913.1 esterase family protein [Nocardia sp. NBC_00508]
MIDRVEPITERWLRVFVGSPAMGRVTQVQVLLPEDRSRPRPTVYLLDGFGARDGASDWLVRGGAREFFADKNVTVVLPTGGPASYYADWQRTDPVLGTNRWETFLTRELPPLIDDSFDGDGRNAVEGVSMGAEAAAMLASRNPGLYTAVAAHSGCYGPSSDLEQLGVRTVVLHGGGDADNMFGPPHEWREHDPTVHAEALRGTAIYLSVGSGIPGEHDVPGNPDLVPIVVEGGPLEAAANSCTHRFAERLTELHIPATVNFRPTGTHSWPYWADELQRSWTTIATGLYQQ